jgi:hypothetical protein
MGRAISTLLWVAAMLSAAAGMFTLGQALFSAESTPQQGALAAMAIGLGVLPYVFVRGFDAIRREELPPPVPTIDPEKPKK